MDLNKQYTKTKKKKENKNKKGENATERLVIVLRSGRENVRPPPGSQNHECVSIIQRLLRATHSLDGLAT